MALGFSCLATNKQEITKQCKVNAEKCIDISRYEQAEQRQNLTSKRSLRRGVQPFVGLGDNVINDGFHIARALIGCELPIRSRTFTHDSLNMRYLALRAEFVHFACHELQQFV